MELKLSVCLLFLKLIKYFDTYGIYESTLLLRGGGLSLNLNLENLFKFQCENIYSKNKMFFKANEENLNKVYSFLSNLKKDKVFIDYDKKEKCLMVNFLFASEKFIIPIIEVSKTKDTIPRRKKVIENRIFLDKKSLKLFEHFIKLNKGISNNTKTDFIIFNEYDLIFFSSQNENVISIFELPVSLPHNFDNNDYTFPFTSLTMIYSILAHLHKICKEDKRFVISLDLLKNKILIHNEIFLLEIKTQREKKSIFSDLEVLYNYNIILDVNNFYEILNPLKKEFKKGNTLKLKIDFDDKKCYFSNSEKVLCKTPIEEVMVRPSINKVRWYDLTLNFKDFLSSIRNIMFYKITLSFDDKSNFVRFRTPNGSNLIFLRKLNK